MGRTQRLERLSAGLATMVFVLVGSGCFMFGGGSKPASSSEAPSPSSEAETLSISATQRWKAVYDEAVAASVAYADATSSAEEEALVPRLAEAGDAYDAVVAELKPEIDAELERIEAALVAAEGQAYVNTEHPLGDEYRALRDLNKKIHRARQDLGRVRGAQEWLARQAEDTKAAKTPVSPDAPLEQRVTAGSPEDVHASRFVFLARRIEARAKGDDNSRPLPLGEPVILRELHPYQDFASVTTIDGESAGVKKSELSLVPLSGSAPHPLRPQWLEVRGEDGKVIGGWEDYQEDATGHDLDDGDFVPLAADQPGYADFIERRAKVVACYADKMETLDPDNLRRKYNRVTYRNGKATKVERLVEVYDKKACKACKCAAFDEKKRALARSVLLPRQEQRYEELRPIIVRLDTAFGSN